MHIVVVCSQKVLLGGIGQDFYCWQTICNKPMFCSKKMGKTYILTEQNLVIKFTSGKELFQRVFSLYMYIKERLDNSEMSDKTSNILFRFILKIPLMSMKTMDQLGVIEIIHMKRYR